MARAWRRDFRSICLGSVFRAVAFIAMMQWLVIPLLVRPVLHAVGSRLGFTNDLAHHVFSAPRILVQDSLVVAACLGVATLLISTEQWRSYGSLRIAVFRRTNLSDGRPWLARGLIGFGAGLVLLSATLDLLAAFGVTQMRLQTRGVADLLRHQAVLLPTFVAAGIAEELLNRGYPLRALSEGFGFGVGALLTSALFGWAHYSEGDTFVGAIGVFEFAIFSCLAIRTTGSIAFSAGFHGAWDYAESALYGVPDSSFVFAGSAARSTFRGSVALSGGTAGPEASVLTLGAMAAMIILLIRFQSNGLRHSRSGQSHQVV